MKRFLERLSLSAASLTRAAAILVLLLALDARAGNYCNNPVPPCDPNDPKSSCYKPPEPPPKCEPLQCGKCTKSPCYVGSGVYVTDATDLEVRTTGFPITISRHYQSSHAIDGGSGYGWVSSLSSRLYYATYLKASPSSYQKEAHIRIPTGTLYRFVENVDGSFAAPEGRFDTLVHNLDGTWDLWLQRSRSRYHFSATGNLTEMVDDFGNTLTWTYVNDVLQRVEDTSGSGRYVDVVYGADGRISDVTDHTGRNVHYTYSAAGTLSGATNPAGQTMSYSYTSGKYVPLLNGIADPWARNITSVVYDAQDRVRSYSQRGETFTYTYAYNGNGSLTAKSDSSGNQWQYPFGPAGLVTEDRPPDGAPSEQVTYYANGLVQLLIDPMGVKTYYTYNARGNLLTITLDYQGTSAVEWRIAYDATYPDQPVSYKAYNPTTNQIHPHWQGSLLEYYPSGSTAPGALYRSYKLADDGVTARLIATYTYDSHGRLLTVVDASGGTTTFAYDGFGNLTDVERPANNDAGLRPHTTYTHDALGRVTSVTDPDGDVSSYTWDVLDRLVTTTAPKPTPSSPLNFTTTYQHDQFDSASQLLFTRIIDPNGAFVRIGRDQYGQTVQTIDQAGNVSRNVFTKGLLTSHIDANGYTTTYAWDSRQRLSTTTFPDGTYERLTYNPDDTIASKRDRLNQTTTFLYDKFKRPAKRTFPNGSSFTYTYLGQKLVQTVDTFAAPSETTDRTWDSWYQLSTETQAARGSISYTYTADGRIATWSTSGGATSTYGYYPSNDVRSITWSRVSGSFLYAYSLAGQTTSITLPNGQTRTSAFDRQGRLTQISNWHPQTGLLASFAYGYDVDPATGQPTVLGLRTSVTANIPSASVSNATTTFGYNNRYQLTSVNYPAPAPYNGLSAVYAYDAAGYRISQSINGVASTYAYNKFASNPLNGPQLQSDGSNAYTYDAEGNVTARSGSRGNFTFTWDFNNNLRTIAGDLAASYAFDAAGRRVAKTVGGATSTFLYDGAQAIEQIGTNPAEYLVGPGIDEPLAMVRGGNVYYYAMDGLDSVVALGDAAGSVQNTYVYDAWGSPLLRNEAVNNSLGYTSREFAEAGLQFNRFRSYEAATGRFFSEDPLQESVPLFGADLYGYVQNSPVMFKDPYGLRCWSFSANGDWVVEQRFAKLTPWELVHEDALPYVPWIRNIIEAIFWQPKHGWLPPGVQYICYWIRFLEVTEHLKRTVSVAHLCDCPPLVWYSSYEQRKVDHHRERGGTTKTETWGVPCSMSPPAP